MIPLAVIVAVIFGVLGLAKILAVPPMRALAAKSGFSIAAYRRVGVLEVAGAAGVALGPVVPLLGVLAACGLLLLLAGALIVHMRRSNGVRELAPALVCAVLVASYVIVLLGST
ncbi:DoxX family protein [Saccharothrix deserti]|uniref:DoxX family protein n=1 Tax=Saccharothrix deserti TaxID=2593674 RepID=UPI00131B2E19|nr:DoxX family protein [Saccharothrix deserti]